MVSADRLLTTTKHLKGIYYGLAGRELQDRARGQLQLILLDHKLVSRLGMNSDLGRQASIRA